MKLKGVQSLFKSLDEKFDKLIEDDLTKNTRAFVSELKTVTPVDTGEAQAGWKTIKVSPTKIAVVNDVEHVKFLNEGSSKQAPAHFVEKTALKHGTPVGAIVELK